MMRSDPVSYTTGRPWRPMQINPIVDGGLMLYSGTSHDFGCLLFSAIVHSNMKY